MENKLSKIDISKLSEEQKELVNCIGIESYYKLSQHYGGVEIYVAKPNSIDKEIRNEMIINEFNKGASCKELALKYGLSTVWIRNIVDRKT